MSFQGGAIDRMMSFQGGAIDSMMSTNTDLAQWDLLINTECVRKQGYHVGMRISLEIHAFLTQIIRFPWNIRGFPLKFMHS